MAEYVDGGVVPDVERAACISRITSGFSKSHGTPCLEQLPHRGWTSSH